MRLYRPIWEEVNEAEAEGLNDDTPHTIKKVRKGFSMSVFGIGNPLLDISSEVQSALLEKYDLKNGNAILAEDKHLPLYAELEKEYPVSYIAGGSAQNTMRVCQWFLQKENAVTYVGSVGTDAYADTMHKEATKGGMRVFYHKDTAATGTCAVLISDGDRSLVANLSAANNYQQSHFETEEVQAALKSADVAYFAGFFLTVSPPTALALAKDCAANKRTLAINLAAPFIVQFFKDPLMDVFAYADWVFGNETEWAAFGEVQGWGSDLPTIGKKAAALPSTSGSGSRIVVITQGKEPTLVIRGDEVVAYPVIPLEPSQIVDVNGAGDSFVGGFLSELCQGKDDAHCIAAAKHAANLIIQQSGCTFPSANPGYTFAAPEAKTL